MPLFDPDYCENRCPVCTKARKGNRIAKILHRIEQILTFGGCPWCRARQRKYGVRPDEPLLLRKDDLATISHPSSDSPPIAPERSPKFRWYQPTPGRLLVGLLAVEAVLLLSERFRWFPINEHKGWTVLIAIASIAVAMLLVLLWFVLALAFRWRFQFSIRLLLVLTVVVAIPFSWLAVEMKRARAQRTAIQAIQKLGGEVEYDFENPFEASSAPPAPLWLRKLAGDEFFADVASVFYRNRPVTDADLEHLKELANCQHLYLANTRVTDAGLEYLEGLTNLRILTLDDTTVSDAGLNHLKGLTNLQNLFLNNTQVTNKGVKELRQALPHCEFYR